MKLNKILLEHYNLIYVTAFEKLIKKMHLLKFKNFNVFYPSTIFIDESPLAFKEYIKSKIEAERKIKNLNLKNKKTLYLALGCRNYLQIKTHIYLMMKLKIIERYFLNIYLHLIKSK